MTADQAKNYHAELDAAEQLDDGNPAELGTQYAQLVKQMPNLTIFGGCCCTDHRHVKANCRAVTSDN